MYHKLFLSISMMLLLLSPSSAKGQDGKFSVLEKGQPVKFNATCFDEVAISKVLTWKEFLGKEFEAQKQFEIDKLKEEHKLQINNLVIEKDILQQKYDFDILGRDNEIKDLRKIVLKNKQINIPVTIAASLAGGVAIGIGLAYAIDNR